MWSRENSELRFLPKPLEKWKKLRKKEAGSRNLVHAKINPFYVMKFMNISNAQIDEIDINKFFKTMNNLKKIFLRLIFITR